MAGTIRSDVERREAEDAMLSDVRFVARALRLAAEQHGVLDDPIKRFIAAAADAVFSDTAVAVSIGRQMRVLDARQVEAEATIHDSEAVPPSPHPSRL